MALSSERQHEIWELAEYFIWLADEFVWFDKTEQDFIDELTSWLDDPTRVAILRRENLLEAFQTLLAETPTLTKFQDFVLQRILARFTDVEELDHLARSINYDDGSWMATQVIRHPACDWVTAKHVYWCLDPCFFYEQYDSLEKAAEQEMHPPHIQLMQEIEDKCRANHFPRGLPEEDMRQQWVPEAIPNFDVQPFCQIPHSLQF